MKWCCLGFNALYESAGNRGASYLVGRDSLGDPEFLIQHRTVDRGDESHVQSDVPALLIVDLRILFCPSCGVNLAKFYEESVDSLYREGYEIDILKKNDVLTTDSPF